MIPGDERSVTINAGVSRSGKSTFALRYMVNAPLAYRFIFDAETGPQSYAQRLRCDSAASAYELHQALFSGWILYSPHEMFPGRLGEAFNRFCEWVFDKSKALPGKKLLLVDEAWRYITPTRYPEELAACVQSGAAYGLACMFNTQLPHKLHEGIQNGCSEVVCFQLHGEKSLIWAESRGFDRAEIEALPQLAFVARNVDSRGELRGRIKL